MIEALALLLFELTDKTPWHIPLARVVPARTIVISGNWSRGGHESDLALKLVVGCSLPRTHDAGMVVRMSGWFPPAAGAVERRVATQRLTMNVVEAGRGRAVLLIHGLGWDHSLWNPTIARLAPHYRVIAADTRGHGATDKPDGPYDMDMFARDYAALADALSLTEICVIGLSQGGMIAQCLALMRPDLVSALILISTSCKSAPSLRDN